jgi:O-antigen/teichoic acid export membrane protein
MENTRIRNTTRNMIAGMIYRVINLLFPFIINTIIIKSLGVEYLGLSSLFVSILQMLSMTELGFGTALIFSLYEPIAKGDASKVSALLALYRKVYVVIGSIILVGGIVCLPLLPLFIKSDVPDGVNIYILFMISLLNSVVAYYMFAYRTALLTACQRKDVVEKLNTITEIAMNISKILILVIVKDYYLFCIMQPIFSVVNSLLTFFISKQMYPEYKCSGSISKEEKKSIFIKVFGVSLNKICNVLSNSFDSVIISSFMGLTILGKYSNYFVITNAVMFFLYIITVSATSSIGNSLVCESQEKNFDDFNTLQFGFNMLVGWSAACLLCLIQPFMELWLGTDMMFDDGTAAIFSIYMYSIMSSAVIMTYREAAGIWEHDKIRPILEAVFNLAINIILVQIIGVSGVMISTILTMGIMRTIWCSHYLFIGYFTKYNQKKYLIKMFFHCIVNMVIGGVCFLLCSLINLTGIAGLLIKLGICIVVPLILQFLTFYRTKEFKKCISMALQVLRHK